MAYKTKRKRKNSYKYKITNHNKLRNQDRNSNNLKTINTKNAKAQDYFNKALILMRKGKFKKALNPLDKAILIEPSNESYYYIKIFCQDQRKKYQECLTVFSKLIALNPRIFNRYRDKAKFLVKNFKDYEQALEVINQGLTILPQSKELVIIKVKYLEYLERYEEIIEVLTDFEFENPYNFHMYI